MIIRSWPKRFLEGCACLRWPKSSGRPGRPAGGNQRQLMRYWTGCSKIASRLQSVGLSRYLRDDRNSHATTALALGVSPGGSVCRASRAMIAFLTLPHSVPRTAIRRPSFAVKCRHTSCANLRSSFLYSVRIIREGDTTH